ncbi:MAG: class III poly(R)-hydroxyalkanoic acid synthase subunit PhaE [Magnetococcales bacterium]|nr:class III poly(R)-hydroxyalkanoic acid synthase subunit PhaE [Magnetococcales bacterium]
MADDTFSVDWMQGWTELQRKIWNEWIAMAGEHLQGNRGFPGLPGMEGANQWPMQWLQQAMAASGSPAGFPTGSAMGGLPWSLPWMQGLSGNPMDDWARSFGVYTPEAKPEQAMAGHMMDAANGFVRLSKGIFEALQNMGEGVQAGNDWTKALDRSIQQAKSFFSGLDTGKAATESMAAWSQPMQAWAEALQSNSALTSGVLQNLMAGSGSGGWPAADGMEAWFKQLMGMPGLGPNREKQERMQAGMRDLMVYQKAAQKFQALSNQVNVKALDLLHKRLLERAATDAPIESMRDLYVLWVDCSEEVNAEFVRSQTFQQANSEMVNAMVRVQNHVQTAMDEMLGTFHLPTRRELNSAHRQVHDLKRRVRKLEEELKSVRTQDHTAELRSIRDDLDRLDVRNLRQELSDMKTLLESARPDSSGSTAKKAASVSRPRAAAREKTDSASVVAAARKGE